MAIQPRVSSSGETPPIALAMMVGAMLLIPMTDGISKYLSAELAPLMISFARFMIVVVLLTPVVLVRGGLRALWPAEIHLHALRGIALAGATLFFFTALSTMEMADVVGIFFVAPLIVTILSSVILGEPIGPRRITAVLVGFFGALLVIRPSFEEAGAAALLPIGAAVCFASYLIITKMLSRAGDPWVMQTMVGISGALFLGLGLVLRGGAEFAVPNAEQAGLLLTMGLIAVGCHTLIILAMKRASASTLAPFQYLEIIGATLIGYFWFEDLPDGIALVGIAIIVASGLYVFHRERARKPALDRG